MPAEPKGAPPSEPTAAPVPEAPAEPAGASSSPEPEAPPTGRLDPGVYEYVAPFATVYGLPLTARPADPGQPATKDAPAVPPSPATVFDWPDGAPADGRWTPTRKKPNQIADNAAPMTTPEV
jgi:2-oxoglutarate dehydrogenase E2 component (dihydrolipoamide succinyltransferase)